MLMLRGRSYGNALLAAAEGYNGADVNARRAGNVNSRIASNVSALCAARAAADGREERVKLLIVMGPKLMLRLWES